MEFHLFSRSQRPVYEALIHDTRPVGAIMVFFCHQSAVAYLDTIAGLVARRVTIDGGNLGRAAPFAEIEILSGGKQRSLHAFRLSPPKRQGIGRRESAL